MEEFCRRSFVLILKKTTFGGFSFSKLRRNIVFYNLRDIVLARLITMEKQLVPRTKEGHYVPLPDFLTIGCSRVHGLGLIATKPIKSGTVLGVTHVWSNIKIEDEHWIRTPLGGFYNHDQINPNCESKEEDGKKYLVTICDIPAGEEITSRYTLYDPTN